MSQLQCYFYSRTVIAKREIKVLSAVVKANSNLFHQSSNLHAHFSSDLIYLSSHQLWLWKKLFEQFCYIGWAYLTIQRRKLWLFTGINLFLHICVFKEMWRRIKNPILLLGLQCEKLLVGRLGDLFFTGESIMDLCGFHWFVEIALLRDICILQVFIL